MNREEMIETVANAKRILPICIPSYKRWNHRDSITLSKLFMGCSEELRDHVYVFVREDQLDSYILSYAGCGYHFVPLPKMSGVKLADTLQYMLDWAKENRMPHIMSLDDDITHLYFLYRDGVYTHHNKVEDMNIEGVVRLACDVALEIFRDNPKTVFGALRRRTFCQLPENSSVKYWVNGGQTPRGVVFYNVKRAFAMGIRHNPIFNPTGTDMGIIAESLQAGGELFSIPSLAYWMVDEKLNSVMRDDSNRKSLALYEYEQFQKYPLKDYLKINQRYDDGQYAFGDIDWKKYHSLMGTEKRCVLWDE